MPEIDIRDKANTVTGRLSLSEKVFGLKGKESLLHEAVANYLANQRQGTHATKTRGLVRGGGKKPWKQKHTGRARSGSTRSPLWKGGGTTFGPQPRDYSYSIPKQARLSALFYALSRKLSDGEVLALNDLKVEGSPKTKDMVDIIKNLDLANKSILIVLPENNINIRLASRNIPNVDVKTVNDINVYDVVSNERLLITEEALKRLEARA
ncbi:MAG: 50S ribosomal protein L4 [Nitrospirae bacterium]|nr:50S ribosomal protein L4 [Nitrospirota bacterium]